MNSEKKITKGWNWNQGVIAEVQFYRNGKLLYVIGVGIRGVTSGVELTTVKYFWLVDLKMVATRLNNGWTVISTRLKRMTLICTSGSNSTCVTIVGNRFTFPSPVDVCDVRVRCVLAGVSSFFHLFLIPPRGSLWHFLFVFYLFSFSRDRSIFIYIFFSLYFFALLLSF